MGGEAQLQGMGFEVTQSSPTAFLCFSVSQDVSNRRHWTRSQKQLSLPWLPWHSVALLSISISTLSRLATRVTLAVMIAH